jgi:hypothetical protein
VNFDGAAPFSEGFARVQQGRFPQTRYGYIDRTGALVIKPQFEIASDFTDGIAMVLVEGKRGYINKAGEYIWKPTR